MDKPIYLFLLFKIITFFQSCKGDVELNQIKTYKGNDISIDTLDDFLKIQMDSLGIPALSIAIINDGEIAYHNALGVSNTTTNQKVDENSIFSAASLAKSTTAFFVMRLSEKGIIDLDRPLYFYLPEKDLEIDQRYKNVSAKMVLSHKTGFPNWRWFDKPPNNLEIDRGDFFMVDDPNSTFTYSGEAYAYLGRVIAHLNFVNMNELGDIFQKEVAEPLEMKHAYVVWDDYLYNNKVFGHIDGKALKKEGGGGLPYINSLMYGGLSTEANSYANFLTYIINGKGLHPETYKEMLRPHTVIPIDNVNYTEDGITHWGLGFGIKPMKNDTIYRHGGSVKGAQSEYAFSVKKKYGYVFFVNCEKGNEFNENLERFLEMENNNYSKRQGITSVKQQISGI